jgi:hypothetical protein
MISTFIFLKAQKNKTFYSSFSAVVFYYGMGESPVSSTSTNPARTLFSADFRPLGRLVDILDRPCWVQFSRY